MNRDLARMGEFNYEVAERDGEKRHEWWRTEPPAVEGRVAPFIDYSHRDEAENSIKETAFRWTKTHMGWDYQKNKNLNDINLKVHHLRHVQTRTEASSVEDSCISLRLFRISSAVSFITFDQAPQF